MPRAHIGDVERWLQDHDTYRVYEAPPVQNTWYPVFQLEDVRLIYCRIVQTNDEAAVKDVEIRWTIDGTEYFVTWAPASATGEFVYRWFTPSTGGTGGLDHNVATRTAAFHVDKRGLDFMVEARLTGVPGTNQILQVDCVLETQEIT